MEWVMLGSKAPQAALLLASSRSLAHTFVLFFPQRISSLILHRLIFSANLKIDILTVSTPDSDPNSS
jgi:hypothetical protein